MKPLFIPLRREHFLAFENGTKTVEYRRHGRCWNERTCFVGRAVTLSYGWSGPRRLRAFVRGISIEPAETDDIYPRGTPLLAIELERLRPLAYSGTSKS